MVPSKRDIFLSTYRRQRFSLTDSMMHYITKNPKNTEGYQKMVQSCKYFFLKNPILIIFGLNYSQTGWTASIKNGYKNIDKNTILCKLWITDTIRVYRDNIINGTFDSSIIPKIYRCAVKYLSLYEQIISLNEFTFLCSSAERLTLEEVTVKNDDGIEVAFENLIKKLPQLKGIVFTFATPSNNTSKNNFKELWKIPHLSNYNYFCLYNIPVDFDIDSFYSFMKKNKKTRIYLEFSVEISEEYKTRLEAIIDEIITTKNHEYKPPCIKFPGLDEKKYLDLYDIFFRR